MTALAVSLILLMIGLFTIHDAVFRLEKGESSVSLKFTIGLALTLISIVAGCYFYFLG